MVCCNSACCVNGWCLGSVCIYDIELYKLSKYCIGILPDSSDPLLLILWYVCVCFTFVSNINIFRVCLQAIHWNGASWTLMMMMMMMKPVWLLCVVSGTVSLPAVPAPGVHLTSTNIPFAGSTISRQARRLYVGNIPFGVTEVTLTFAHN